MSNTAALLALAVLTLAPAAVRAQTANREAPQPAVRALGRTEGGATERTAAATRAEQPPVLDGRMDDPVWRDAQEITRFRQFDPVEDGEPLFPTMAKVAYDERNLYVFVRAYDPRPDSIVSLLSRRDVRTESDQIKIMVDSYLDRRTGYEFAVNPAGVKRDYYMHGDVNEDDSWDAVWEVATAIDSLGWTAEFRIPLSQLRFAEKEVHTFGFAVWRDIARAAQRVSWPVYRRTKPGVVSQLGEVSGIAGIGTGRRLEIAPYVVTKNVTRQSADDYSHPQEHAVGADLKVGVTSNLTVDATINPDFGQVESDPAQFNLSSTESFFDERRPFFLEGTGIFNFNLSCNDGNCSGLFYSRRIGRAPRLRGWVHEDPASPDVTTILGAAKLTGRLGNGLSIGVLNAVTDREEERDPFGSGAATIEPMSNYFVGRLQQDFREGKSGVGLMATAVNRRLDEWTEAYYRRSGYALGVDGRHRFAEEWQIGGYVVASEVQGTEAAIAELQTCDGAFGCVHNYTRPDDDLAFDPSRTRMRGASMQLGLEKIGGKRWRGSTYYTRTNPGFEINDVGFVGRDDIQSFSNWWQRRWETPTSWYRRVFVNFNQWTSGTTTGLLTDMGGNINAHAEFTNRWWIHYGFNYNNWVPTYCDRNCTRGGPALKESAGEIYTWFGAESDFRKPVAFWANVEYGRADEGNSESWWMGPGMNFRLASRLQGRINASLSLNEDDAQYYGTFDADTDAPRYTVARLEQRTVSVTSRLDFTATPTLSLQFYGQPFVTTGEYTNVREVTDPRADRYVDRFTPAVIVDEFGRPTDPGGFDYKQFRSNTVVRWEYRPGSTLFLVWAQGRTSDDEFQDFDLRRSTRTLFRRHPDNTFLVKVNYWFNP